MNSLKAIGLYTSEEWLVRKLHLNKTVKEIKGPWRLTGSSSREKHVALLPAWRDIHKGRSTIHRPSSILLWVSISHFPRLLTEALPWTELTHLRPSFLPSWTLVPCPVRLAPQSSPSFPPVPIPLTFLLPQSTRQFLAHYEINLPQTHADKSHLQNNNLHPQHGWGWETTCQSCLGRRVPPLGGDWIQMTSAPQNLMHTLINRISWGSC